MAEKITIPEIDRIAAKPDRRAGRTLRPATAFARSGLATIDRLHHIPDFLMCLQFVIQSDDLSSVLDGHIKCDRNVSPLWCLFQLVTRFVQEPQFLADDQENRSHKGLAVFSDHLQLVRPGKSVILFQRLDERFVTHDEAPSGRAGSDSNRLCSFAKSAGVSRSSRTPSLATSTS